ncbi:MAG: hypothetical protein N2595_06170 [bacterium]|nr:hypothetical protein [bacterium]
MKAFITCVILLVMASSLYAAQDVLILKTKKRLVGTVTNVTERGLSIRTAQGLFTYPWEALHEQSLKIYNPPMYEKLMEQRRKAFEELKRKQGLVQYKGRWMTPKQKEAAEMRDKGMDLFEGKWLPTNEIAAIKFRRQMEAEGKIEYKGQWYTEAELAEVKEMERNRGLKVGMKEDEVIAKWGKPTRRKESESFKAQQMEMWFYAREDEGVEDRLLFKMGTLSEIQLDQPLSE